MQVLAAGSCPTLCDPMDYSPTGCSVHGVLQARILEWFAISFSMGSSSPRDWTWVFCIAGRFFTIKCNTKWQWINGLVILRSLNSTGKWNGEPEQKNQSNLYQPLHWNGFKTRGKKKFCSFPSLIHSFNQHAFLEHIWCSEGGSNHRMFTCPFLSLFLSLISLFQKANSILLNYFCSNL